MKQNPSHRDVSELGMWVMPLKNLPNLLCQSANAHQLNLACRFLEQTITDADNLVQFRPLVVSEAQNKSQKQQPNKLFGIDRNDLANVSWAQPSYETL